MFKGRDTEIVLTDAMVAAGARVLQDSGELWNAKRPNVLLARQIIDRALAVGGVKVKKSFLEDLEN